MAQRFDPGALKLSGEPFAIAERVGLLQGGGTRSLFSASRTGVVAYRGDESRVAQLTWFSRNGDKLGVLGPAGPWRAPALSPDQRSVAVVRVDNKVGDDVWVIDTLLGKATPLTSGAGWQNSPMWAPDNRYIIFSSDHNGPFNLFRKRADGVGEEEHVFSSPNWKFAMDWSPDGGFVIYQEIDPKTKLDLWALSLTDRRASTLVRTPFDEYDATFSPDGQWFAYVGEASGQPEIYVQPFGGGSGRWQASIAGGTQPIWTSGGSELVYVALDGMIMSVSVRESGSALDLASPRPLFRSSLQKALTTSLAVTRDGQRFLIPVMDEHHEIEPITVLVNATDSTR
jgi:Tol biopolymer transport system component